MFLGARRRLGILHFLCPASRLISRGESQNVIGDAGFSSVCSPLFFSVKPTFDLAGCQSAYKSEFSECNMQHTMIESFAMCVSVSFMHCSVKQLPHSLLVSRGVLSSCSCFLFHSPHLTKLLIMTADMSHRVI